MLDFCRQMPLSVTFNQFSIYGERPNLQLFLSQIKDMKMPPNALTKVFKKVDTSLLKMKIKGLGNKKVLKPSIAQKSSYRFHPSIGSLYFYFTFLLLIFVQGSQGGGKMIVQKCHTLMMESSKFHENSENKNIHCIRKS